MEKIRHQDFDLNQLEIIHNPLKRKHWLASRCLILEMDSSIGRILYDDIGAPQTDIGKKISLSHSHEMIAVTLSPKNEVGIDIQYYSPKIFRIRGKYCSEKELKFAEEFDENRVLQVLWSAKEAMYKFLKIPGVIFKKELIVEPFEMANSGRLNAAFMRSGRKQEIDLQYEIFGDYTLAYTLNR